MKNMKTFLFIVSALLMAGISNAQISVLKPAPKKIEAQPFDSTQNYLSYVPELIMSYIGQQLFFFPNNSSKEYGYRGFCNSPKESDIYYPISTYEYSPQKDITIYDSIVGRTFNVIDFVSAQKESESSQDMVYYLKLEDVENGEIIYYMYPEYEHNAKWLCLGYLSKLRKKLSSNKYYYIGIKQKFTDPYTGETFDLIRGKDIWTFYDLSINNEYFYLQAAFKNKAGNHFVCMIDISYILEPTKIIDSYRKLYGSDMVNLALSDKIKIGMPADLVRLAWGTPRDINRSSYGPEQWCYDGQYVYIENGKVKSWN